jgi:predicted TIM-barrel fold metal-dependent hydrolase
LRNGFKVYDSDTHVQPAAEVLEQYVDPSFRPKLQELERYKSPLGSYKEDGTQLHLYRIDTKYYRRVLGHGTLDQSFTGRESRWMGSKPARPRVQDDKPDNRVQDMDDEGADVHFLIPATWTGIVGLKDEEVERGLNSAYHRYMADYCAQSPERLKGMILVSGLNVEHSVAEIRQWGKSKWAVAVRPILDKDMPPDHPDLEPIWKAAVEHDLAVVHHSSTWNPPHFPGYQDLWDNIFLGRLASHPWGAMRFMAAFIGAGIMDRYPTIRMGVLECGFGWLPFWCKRMNEQASYVGGTAELKHQPSEYVSGGRFFCSIEMHEGEDMVEMVTSFLGEDVLMYASDYPHSECRFPDSVDHVLGWPTLGNDMKRKLMWDNATRFYKHI